jgi:hypothetical protein
MENRFGAVGAIKSPHVDLGAINGEQACALAAHLRAQSPGFQAVCLGRLQSQNRSPSFFDEQRLEESISRKL